MNDEMLKRPVGWWLKEADAQLNAAFDVALQGAGADRRSWQILNSLSRGPMPRADVMTALASFDGPAAVDEILDLLRAREWVQESDEPLALTAAGAVQHQALAPLVDGVRQRVAAALPPDDYVTLIELLARLAKAVSPPATTNYDVQP